MQPLCALALSLYIAIYLAEDVFLNVVLNIVALEFVAEVDEQMISAFLKTYYGEHSSVSVALLDVTYARDVHENNDFWQRSDSSKAKVQRALSGCVDGEITNASKWELLISPNRGLGLLGNLPDDDNGSNGSGRKCVTSFMMKVGIVDWSTMEDTELVEQGGLYLAATTNFEWEHVMNRKQVRRSESRA